MSGDPESISGMGRKVVEPEHFVYIVLTQTDRGNDYEYESDFPTFEEAEKLADRLSSPAKIIRARRATVLRFLKREPQGH